VTHRQQKSQLNALATIRVDISVDVAKKNLSTRPRQDSPGRRSRGGHVCPPCLDGPDGAHRHNGLGRPLWAGLEAPPSSPTAGSVLSLPLRVSREAGGVAVHDPCKCVTPFVDILQKGVSALSLSGTACCGTVECWFAAGASWPSGTVVNGWFTRRSTKTGEDFG